MCTRCYKVYVGRSPCHPYDVDMIEHHENDADTNVENCIIAY